MTYPIYPTSESGKLRMEKGDAVDWVAMTDIRTFVDAGWMPSRHPLAPHELQKSGSNSANMAQIPRDSHTNRLSDG